jgi:ubiquinone/menaquinone biosynthesis C-methylase UbiE
MPRRDRNAASSSEKSRRYHDRVARQYDAIYDDPYWHFHDELTWRMVKPYLPKDLSAACADLGCGTGKWGLKLLKSGFPTTFLDHAAAMVEQARQRVVELGEAKARKATFTVADIVDMPQAPSSQFALTLAMGDPLSICSDPQRAANEMFRISAPGGIIIASADSKLAALDHFVERGNLDALEAFVTTGRTTWLTADERERFELTMFTPATLRKTFERAGFDVISVAGKPIIPVRQNKHLFTHPDAVQRLLRLEAELAKDPASAAKAGHLQVVARRPASAGAAPGTPTDMNPE